MDELKQLFNELFTMLEKSGDSSYNPQKLILRRILQIIDGNDNELNKFEQVKSEYKKIFFPKSALSEFYIWNSDFSERKRLNDSLENIKNRLWELLK